MVKNVTKMTAPVSRWKLDHPIGDSARCFVRLASFFCGAEIYGELKSAKRVVPQLIIRQSLDELFGFLFGIRVEGREKFPKPCRRYNLIGMRNRKIDRRGAIVQIQPHEIFSQQTGPGLMGGQPFVRSLGINRRPSLNDIVIDAVFENLWV